MTTSGAIKPAPCMVMTAMIGAIMRAASIRSPWKKSVQHTALKPPRNVYTMMMTAAPIIAVFLSIPITVLNRVPQADILDAAYIQYATTNITAHIMRSSLLSD